MPDDATEGVAEHSSRLQPSINLHAPLQPLCSAALVPNVLPEGMKAQVGLISPSQLLLAHHIHLFSPSQLLLAHHIHLFSPSQLLLAHHIHLFSPSQLLLAHHIHLFSPSHWTVTSPPHSSV